MTNLFSQGLLITAIGMGLVFAALALLWGIMALMGRLMTTTPEAPAVAAPALKVTPQAAGDPAPGDDEIAAIAAALALIREEQEAEAALSWRLPPVLTRWAAVGYSRQLHSWQPRRTKRDA